jgi:light-regulated signal transduction histidine kinase (bacteriophytochrome)
MLRLARISREALKRESVELTVIARQIALDLAVAEPSREVSWTMGETAAVTGDGALLRAALENLLGNAWTYTSKTPAPKIEFGETVAPTGERAFFVADNGAGFDMKYADKLFGAFQRLHAASDFPGTGIGLATTKRIIERHGGRIWAESAPGRGAKFCFTLEKYETKLPATSRYLQLADAITRG